MVKYTLYKIAEFIVLHLPRKFGYALAIFLSDLKFWISKTDRRNVLANINAVIPDGKNNVKLTKKLKIKRYNQEQRNHFAKLK